MAGDGTQSFLFWAFDCKRVPENNGVVEENPDDAAVENSGTGVTIPWPFICHAQLVNPREGPASASGFLVALSCEIQETSPALYLGRTKELVTSPSLCPILWNHKNYYIRNWCDSLHACLTKAINLIYQNTILKYTSSLCF